MLGGNAGRKRGSVNYKTIMRIERAVQMEAKGYPDDQIAKHIGLSKAGLITLKRNPLYQQVRVRTQSFVVGELEQDLGENIDYCRNKLNSMLPKALQVLEKALENPDPKVALNAADSVFDRNGRLAKISRIGLPTEEQGGIGPRLDTSVADALVDAIKGLNSGNSSTNSTSTTVQ